MEKGITRKESTQKGENLSYKYVKTVLYMKKSNDNETPLLDFKDYQVTSCNACTGVVKLEEGFSVDHD